MRGFWKIAACFGLVWLAVGGLARLAVGQAGSPERGEPKPGIPWAQQKSGTMFLSPSNRAQQDDLTVNPGMLWVEKGGELWAAAAGTSGKSCADCHGDPEKLSGVAARYPVFDAKKQRLHSIETRVQECRTERQGAAALAPESDTLLSLSALVAHQSRGQPMAPAIDGPAQAGFEAGQALYTSRFGQMNLSCAQCHEQSWGQRLRSEVISQGHGNGYPLYRLEWQKMGSLYRRLRSCFQSVRSVAPAHGSPEHLALELYLAWRAKGLPVETPAIRR
jgi:L-cysteine S-thiosulfotransferase